MKEFDIEKKIRDCIKSYFALPDSKSHNAIDKMVNEIMFLVEAKVHEIYQQIEGMKACLDERFLEIKRTMENGTIKKAG